MKYLKLFEDINELDPFGESITENIDWNDFDIEESPQVQDDNEFMNEWGNIRCNNCMWIGNEEDLELHTNKSGNIVEMCPNCKSTNGLMDI